LLSLALLIACDAADTPPMTDAAAAVGQGNEPRGDVAVNEVAFRGEDWVELTNRGAAAIDLSGWFLTDAADRLDHYYELPSGSILPPGAYLVVPTPFGLGEADSVFVLGRTGLVVDAFLYLADDDDVVLARLPDRDGLFFSTSPTPGTVNQ
jgi:hypothetical protein